MWATPCSSGRSSTEPTFTTSRSSCAGHARARVSRPGRGRGGGRAGGGVERGRGGARRTAHRARLGLLVGLDVVRHAIPCAHVEAPESAARRARGARRRRARCERGRARRSAPGFTLCGRRAWRVPRRGWRPGEGHRAVHRSDAPGQLPSTRAHHAFFVWAAAQGGRPVQFAASARKSPF